MIEIAHGCASRWPLRFDGRIRVRADADNVDRLKRALMSVWDDPEIGEITADDLAGEYPTVR